MNTGTPALENASARICSVTVLPVPVVPRDQTVTVTVFQQKFLRRGIAFAAAAHENSCFGQNPGHAALFIQSVVSWLAARILI